MKPDCDNLGKAVLDCMENIGLFEVGDQQVSDIHIIKLWCPASEAGVMVRVEGIALVCTEAEKPGWLME